MRAPSPRWNSRCCAGRGRSAGTAGLIHALKTFRAAARASCIRSDPRTQPFGRGCSIRRRTCRSPRGGACAAGNACRAKPASFAEIAARHREVVAALGDDGDGKIARLRRHATAQRWPLRSRRSPTNASATAFAIALARLSGFLPRRDRRPRGAAAGPAGRARAYLRPAGSAAAERRPRWCSAAWSKAPGRRRRAAIPGSTARCATSSASICRSGASAFPRMTSRRRSARRK